MGTAKIQPIPEKPSPLFPEITGAEDRFRSCIQGRVPKGRWPYGKAMDYPPRRIIGTFRGGMRRITCREAL